LSETRIEPLLEAGETGRISREPSCPLSREPSMKDVIEDELIEAPRFSGRWQELANRVLEGHRLTEEEGLAILRSGDEELLDVLAAAYRVRYHWHGNRVLLSFLINAKSGRCAEDCAYCSQSGKATSDIPKYAMLDTEELYAGAEQAA